MNLLLTFSPTPKIDFHAGWFFHLTSNIWTHGSGLMKFFKMFQATPGTSLADKILVKYNCAYNHGWFSAFERQVNGVNKNENRDSKMVRMAHFPSGSSI